MTRVALALIFLLGIAPRAGWAQTPSQLPPAAQQALDKGIIAARVPDYPLAISLFQSARRLAPAAPVVYLNLGLAESKIPGRELRAIAWFGAYLAAYPSAPNAAVVKAVIVDLDAKNQSNISRLIKNEQDIAIQRLPGDQGYLRYVAALYANTGNIPAALATTQLIQDETYRGQARAATAAGQTKAKRTEAEALMASGNIAGARQTLASAQTVLALIGNHGERLEAQLALAQAQMRAGDTAGARDSFVAAQKITDAFDSASDKAKVLISIAEAQGKAGDAAAARETFELARKAAMLIQDAFDKNIKLSEVAVAQAESGDIAGAQKAAELIEGDLKTWAFPGIARAQARAGDIAGALKTDNLSKFRYPGATLIEVAEAQIRAGDLAGAQESFKAAEKAADRTENGQSKTDAFIRIVEALRKTGDIEGTNRVLISAQRAADRVPFNKGGGLTSAGSDKRQSQAAVARTRARVGVANFATFDWLQILDGNGDPTDYSDYGAVQYPLNSAPFLNLAGHLGAAPSAATAEATLDYLHQTTEKIIATSNAVREMLKQQGVR